MTDIHLSFRKDQVMMDQPLKKLMQLSRQLVKTKMSSTVNLLLYRYNLCDNIMIPLFKIYPNLHRLRILNSFIPNFLSSFFINSTSAIVDICVSLQEKCAWCINLYINSQVLKSVCNTTLEFVKKFNGTPSFFLCMGIFFLKFAMEKLLFF